MSLNGCTALTSVSFTTNNIISSFDAPNCALPQAAVDAILAALGSTVSSGVVNLSGGSTASPSSTSDVDRLTALGWTVATN